MVKINGWFTVNQLTLQYDSDAERTLKKCMTCHLDTDGGITESDNDKLK